MDLAVTHSSSIPTASGPVTHGAARVDAAALAAKLVGWNSDRSATMPLRLAATIQDLAATGALASGTLLPPERALASALGISRTTVQSAYAALREGGWLTTRQGSGARLRGTGTAGPTSDGRLATITGHEASDVCDLSTASLPAHPAVAEAFSALADTELQPYLDAAGYWPYGIPALRAAVADYYTAHDLPTTPHQILITTGAQQAVSLLAHARLTPGDRAVVDDPSHRGVLSALTSRQAQLLPIPVSANGPDLRVLDLATRTTVPRMAYVVPTAHPYGINMSTDQQHRVAKLVTDRDMFTVIDGSSLDLLWDAGHPRLPLARLVRANQSALIGSASSLYWPGLRVGWIRTAPDLVNRLADLRRPWDLGGSVVDQVVTADLLTNWHIHRPLRHEWVRQHAHTTLTQLSETVPDWQWNRPNSGTTVWIRVPGADTVTLSVLAYQHHRIQLLPGPFCSPVSGHRDVLQFPLTAEPDALVEALPILAALADDPRVSTNTSPSQHAQRRVPSPRPMSRA